MSIKDKFLEAFGQSLSEEAQLEKARREEDKAIEHEESERKSFVDLDISAGSQGIYRERYSMAGPAVLKNMARKDSLIIAVHQALVNQVSNFTQKQKDIYSPGFTITPKNPADLSDEDKLSLADPELDEEAFAKKKFELDKKLAKLQQKQKEEIEKIENFIQHCGTDKEDTDTTYKRFDFDKFVKLIVRDRLTYNYAAIELIPTADREKISHFYAVSAGTIRYVSSKSMKEYKEITLPAIQETMGPRHAKAVEGKPFRYVQVLRGKPVAAFTEDQLIYEAGNPSVDPEDYGYATGELEWLIGTITSHLYAEGHNRNFFTQGVGTKGILHIKGNNISRTQLEGFKRQWFNKLSSSKNSFRPPVIGMAEDVKWVPLSQSNREMEFENWMNYLIRIVCAVYQIDPSEINFDISKTNASTLNESNNEQKVKSSKTKGLHPLLMYVQNILNHQILPRWDRELSDKYTFEFVGLDAETKMQEIDRYQKESQVYKTINEIRKEKGKAPIEDGDIILAATYTQYLQMQLQQQQAMMGGDEMMAGEGVEGGGDEDHEQDFSDVEKELDEVMSVLDEEPDTKEEDTKKSVVIEYHYDNED